jgi:8-oxo-dGTP diphosphatase
MIYTPIMATLGYVLSPDRQSILMIHRNTRPDDQHYGKYNGLGGKIETHEDIVSAMQREIQEEAGIYAHTLTLRGTINWPGFGPNGENWFGFIFRIDGWSGTPHPHSPEGTLEWVPLSHLHMLNLWPGDHHFLPLVLNNDPRQFHGIMPYDDNDHPISWSYQLIGISGIGKPLATGEVHA